MGVVYFYGLLHKLVPDAFQQELCRTVGKVALLSEIAGASLLHNHAYTFNKVFRLTLYFGFKLQTSKMNLSSIRHSIDDMCFQEGG